MNDDRVGFDEKFVFVLYSRIQLGVSIQQMADIEL